MIRVFAVTITVLFPRYPFFYHKSYSLGKSYTHCFRLFYYTPVLPFLNMRM